MHKFIGTKQFYKNVFAIALPIMAQNGISNIVNMLDNLMVGRIGTEQLSGVSIVNDLMFVYQLCLFGAISGAGIFTAQYFGQRNEDGVRDTFRIKLVICGFIMLLGFAVFGFGDRTLISYYLHEGSQSGDLATTLQYGHTYMMFMLAGLLPQAAEFVYSSTLRETGETVIPMRASFAAVFINLVLNYILIYGKFGFPVLGVAGAAIATASAAAAGAMIGVGASAVKTGAEFDTAMSQVAATMGKSVADIEELRDFAQEMGSTTAFSASQAAEALNYMALAGYDADTSSL